MAKKPSRVKNCFISRCTDRFREILSEKELKKCVRGRPALKGLDDLGAELDYSQLLLYTTRDAGAVEDEYQ
jgi:hypothetical protein